MLVVLSLLRLPRRLFRRLPFQLSGLSRKHPDVVHEALDEEVVVVRLVRQGPTALVDQSLGVQFDLQLVRLGFLFGLVGKVSLRSRTE